MLECFICKQCVSSVEHLISHIQIDHKLCGVNEYVCAVCNATLDELWKFKRHLIKCCSGAQNVPERIDETGIDLSGVEINSLLEKEVLRLVCKLSSNMSFSRSAVFEIVDTIDQFIQDGVTQALEKIILPSLVDDSKNKVVTLIDACKHAFLSVRTECKLNSTLKKLNLLEPVTKIKTNQDDENTTSSGVRH